MSRWQHTTCHMQKLSRAVITSGDLQDGSIATTGSGALSELTMKQHVSCMVHKILLSGNNGWNLADALRWKLAGGCGLLCDPTTGCTQAVQLT